MNSLVLQTVLCRNWLQWVIRRIITLQFLKRTLRFFQYCISYVRRSESFFENLSFTRYHTCDSKFELNMLFHFNLKAAREYTKYCIDIQIGIRVLKSRIW